MPAPHTDWWALAVAILAYLVLTILMASRRFWHDELFTLYIATAPGWEHFRRNLTLDLNPPLQYFAVRATARLFGTSPLALRMPFILAFLGGSLCVWRFVGKRLSSEYGVLAVMVIWASPFFYYATEARPYALIVGFLGAALLLWQRTTEAEKANAGVVLALAAAVSGMMLSHLMAVLYVLPLCLAEALRTRQSRKWRFGIWAALLLPCVIPFVYQHMLARVEETAIPPAFRASLHKTAESYYGSLRLEALPLLVALILSLVFAHRQRAAELEGGQGPTRIELALIAGFLATPALANFALMMMRGAYFDRYALPVVFGYALVISFFVAQQTKASRGAALVASSVLLLFICALDLGPHLKNSVWARRDKVTTAQQKFEQIRPDLPLVAASGLTFLEMDHYEGPQTVARLFYLTDRPRALQYAGATMFESLADLKHFFPIRAQILPFAQFAATHHSFLVLGTPDYPEDWLLRSLVATPATVRYLGDFQTEYKDSQLYQVTLP